MKKITNAADLKTAIIELEYKQASELILLRKQVLYTYENMQPLNLIKNIFKEKYSVPDLKTNVVNSAIGIATGLVAKKVLLGATNNPFTKLLGFIMEMVVASKVAKNGDKIKSIGSTILEKIVDKGNGSS